MQRIGEKGAAVSALVVLAAIAGALWGKQAGAGVPVQVLTLALGVVAAAGFSGWWAGLASAAITVLAYNYFFTEPLYTLVVDDPQNYIVFGLLLTAGILVGTLNERLKRAARKQIEQEREIQSATLLQGISHDLRTPIAAILSDVEALRHSKRSRLDAEDLLRVTEVEDELKGLTRQIENVLTLTEFSAQSTAAKFTLIPAEEALYSCRDRFQKWNGNRTLRVCVPEDLPLVRAEVTLLEQALLNLIENADRYSPLGKEIEISVDCTTTSNAPFVEFCVKDRGPGIPDSDKLRIFQKFTRVESNETKRRGSGLGLAIVEQSARILGGTCGVRDREGGGSEFWLRLPRAAA